MPANSQPACGDGLRRYHSRQRQSSTISDWELLADAFLGDDFAQPSANVGDKLMLGAEIVEDPIYLWEATNKEPLG